MPETRPAETDLRPAEPEVQPSEPLAPPADEDAQPGYPASIEDSPTQELQVTPPRAESPPPPLAEPPPLPPSGQSPQGGPDQQWQQPGQQWQQPGQQWQHGHPPPQQWQQPPAGWQQQPRQWQGSPPPYPPQGWAPQTQPWAGPQYSTSGLVAIAGLLLAGFGLLIAVAGAFGFTQGNELGRFVRDYADRIAVFGQRIDRETLRAFLSVMPSVLIVAGIVQLLVGAGVLAHKGWARGLGSLISILGVLVGVFAVSAALALAPGTSAPMLIAIVLLLGYAFVLLALLAGGSHFRARYRGR